MNAVEQRSVGPFGVRDVTRLLVIVCVLCGCGSPRDRGGTSGSPLDLRRVVEATLDASFELVRESSTGNRSPSSVRLVQDNSGNLMTVNEQGAPDTVEVGNYIYVRGPDGDSFLAFTEERGLGLENVLAPVEAMKRARVTSFADGVADVTVGEGPTLSKGAVVIADGRIVSYKLRSLSSGRDFVEEGHFTYGPIARITAPTRVTPSALPPTCPKGESQDLPLCLERP